MSRMSNQSRDVREWLSTFPFPPIPILLMLKLYIISHHHHQISLIKSCHAQLNYKDVVTIKNRKIKIWINGTKHNSTELSVTRSFSS